MDFGDSGTGGFTDISRRGFFVGCFLLEGADILTTVLARVFFGIMISSFVSDIAREYQYILRGLNNCLQINKW
jgi:hypothetical protein